MAAYVLDNTVPLPRDLNPGMIRRAVDKTERDASGLVEVYYEQRNTFSTLVGIFGARALESVSTYERSPHRYQAQGSFPDLRRRGSRGNPPAAGSCLESKGSMRDWPIQAHYDHSGWYVVWRYLVDESLTISGRPVVIWRVDVVFLKNEDWKYEKSTAGVDGGGRTETFGVIRPATRLRGAAAYRRTDIQLVGGKPVPVD